MYTLPMKKVLQFIYPYQYLHSKWWHRLLFVLITLGTLLFGVSIARVIRWNVAVYESTAEVKIQDIQDDYELVCESIYQKCDYSSIERYLSLPEVRKKLANHPGYNQLKAEIVNSIRVSGWNNDINFYPSAEQNKLLDKVAPIASDLDKRGVIDVVFSSKLVLHNILLIIFTGITSALVAWVIIFGVVYRVLMYIVYGKRLGKQN